MNAILNYGPVFLAGLSSAFLLINRKYRANIIGLALIYVAAFWMILEVWSPGLSIVKLITGWMAGAIIGSSIKEERQLDVQNEIVEQRFKAVFVLILWIFCISITGIIKSFLPLNENLILGGLVLFFTGLLQIGLSKKPIRIIFGMMVTIVGFEVIYAGLEKSILVAAFLVVITVGIAFVGVLFLNQEEDGAV
jgi:hypothetical protein